MIMTTSAMVEGRPVAEYLGIVTGQTVLGVNVFRDIGAALRNIGGGRAKGYEKELLKGRDEALAELQQEALELGADAVIGIDLDYESVNNGMLMVSASGTAVRLSR